VRLAAVRSVSRLDRRKKGARRPGSCSPGRAARRQRRAGALDSGVTLAEAAVLARHANAKVTGAIYAAVGEKAKAQVASKLVDAGFGS